MPGLMGDHGSRRRLMQHPCALALRLALRSLPCLLLPHPAAPAASGNLLLLLSLLGPSSCCFARWRYSFTTKSTMQHQTTAGWQGAVRQGRGEGDKGMRF